MAFGVLFSSKIEVDKNLTATNLIPRFVAVAAMQLILTMIKAGRQEDATSPAAFLFLRRAEFDWSCVFNIDRDPILFSRFPCWHLRNNF